MFRYYEWLPTEIEPDYHDGYSCDQCGVERNDGPLFHDASSGTDYCVECGTGLGFSPFCGLVSSLLYSDGETAIQDEATGAIALFAYQTAPEVRGVVFSDGSSLLLVAQHEKDQPMLLHSVKERGKASSTAVSERVGARRFPWVRELLLDAFPVHILLHPTPSTPSVCTPHEVRVHCFDANDRYVCLSLDDGFVQILDSEMGVEVVAKNRVVVAAFFTGERSSVTKTEAGSMLHAALQSLEQASTRSTV